MQRPSNPFELNQPVTMPLREIAELLVKHHGLHEGLFDLAFEFQVAVGAVGPQPDMVVPGAMIGVSRIGLAKTQQVGPHTVDAEKVNPVKKAPKKTRAVVK